MLKMKELLTGELAKLKAVIRFNNVHRLRDESVAEHTFYVTFYAMAVALWLELNTELRPNWRRLMMRCLVHDLDEGISGDFPRNFKYSSPELADMLGKAAEAACQTMLGDFMRPGILKDQLYHNWRCAKDRSTEGMILALADLLSVLSVTWLEAQLGNRLIIEQTRDLPGNLRAFALDAQHFLLTPLVQEAEALAKELYDGTTYCDSERAASDPRRPGTQCPADR